MTLVLGVAGVGLIGGSIALRARAGGATVVGFDSDPAALRDALAGGALDATAASLAELAEGCEVVALAMPIEATLAALRDAPALAAPALVFDVASVKAAPAAAGRHLPRFVPSHPLAGRETGGFGAANAALFEGRTWAIDAGAAAEPRARLEAFVTSLGARPLAIDPGLHDRLVAVTSHLPQMLSVVLGARLAAAGDDDDQAYALCGPGITSMLRLARSPVDLWTAIAAANAAPLAAELRAAAAALDELAAALEAGTDRPLAAAFAAAARAVSHVEQPASSPRSLTDTVSSR